MELVDWIPAISINGLIVIALWLSKNTILNRLTKSVQHEFDKKLEKLKADIRSKEIEIANLRSGAMNALANRQISLDKRKLEAVDQLWSSVIALKPGISICMTMSIVNLDAVSKEIESNKKLQDFFKMMGTGFDIKQITTTGADEARPFISPVTWAIYSALLAIVMHYVGLWTLFSNGMKSKDLMDNDAINNLLKTALPHQAEYIDKYGSGGYFNLFKELESKLLESFKEMLAGKDDDAASLEQAAEILAQSYEILNKNATEVIEEEEIISASAKRTDG